MSTLAEVLDTLKADNLDFQDHFNSITFKIDQFYQDKIESVQRFTLTMEVIDEIMSLISTLFTHYQTAIIPKLAEIVKHLDGVSSKINNLQLDAQGLIGKMNSVARTSNKCQIMIEIGGTNGNIGLIKERLELIHDDTSYFQSTITRLINSIENSSLFKKETQVPEYSEETQVPEYSEETQVPEYSEEVLSKDLEVAKLKARIEELEKEMIKRALEIEDSVADHS